MKTKKGVITSAKTQNTVTVMVTRYVVHPKYRKRYPVSKKFLADSAGHDVKEGDTVLIEETKPISKRKRFKVSEIISTAPSTVNEPSLETELASTRAEL